MPVQMDQEDLRRGRTHLNDLVMGCGYPRLTSIPVEGDGRDKISVCGSRDGKLSTEATIQCPFPVAENLTVDREIARCKPKISFGI